MTMTLEERAIQAAKSFLERAYYVIKDVDGEFPIVATDENNVLVFIDVTVDDGAFIDEHVNRNIVENRMLRTLLALDKSEYVNMKLRYDIISLAVLDDSRAMLRHHINAMSFDTI